MIPNRFFLLCGCLCIFSIQAQKNIDPTPEQISQAKKLREIYTKDDIALLEGIDKFSFDLNKKEGKVQVYQDYSEVLMNLNHRADIHKYEFYDGESSIQNFAIKYRNDKTAFFSVKDEYYKDNDLFYNDAKVKYTQVDFPVQGYNYKYEMTKKYEDVKYCTSLYFNDEFPILKREIHFTIPDWLEVELKEYNFEGYSIRKTTKKEGSNTHISYFLENIPAAAKDENAPGRSYLYPHLLILAKSYTIDGKTIPLFRNSSDLYQWYRSLIGMMQDNPTVFKSKVEELTAKAKTDEEKIKNIYYWVQDNIRYIAFEDGIAGFKPDESNHVFEKRYGDCKGMANLIKQMLKLAGFDARLCWIGTKHISYDYSIPSLAVDNHMICAVLFKGKKIFLDGTEKFNAFGEYAERIQNKEVMIENGEQCLIEKIPPHLAIENKEVFKAQLKLENETITGNCYRNYAGESRAQFLNFYHNFETSKRQELLNGFLSRHNKNTIVSNIKTSDLTNREIPITLDYQIKVNNRVSAFDTELFIDLDLMNEYKNFELKDRTTDYEMDYKTLYDSEIVLTVPEFYKIVKLPDNLTIKETDFEVSLTYEQVGNTIVYKKTFHFKKGSIQANNIAKWNAFHKQLVENYNQQITLTK